MKKVSPEEQAALKKSLGPKKGKGKGKGKGKKKHRFWKPEPVLTRKHKKQAPVVAEDEPPKGLKRKRAASVLKSTSEVDDKSAAEPTAKGAGRGPWQQRPWS